MKFESMVSALSVFCTLGTIVDPASSFATEIAPAKASIKICGAITKQKTQYDGVKFVFAQFNDQLHDQLNDQLSDPPSDPREIVYYYYVVAVRVSVQKSLDSLTINKTQDACIVGFQSEEQVIDSPPDFYASELLF